MADSGKREGEMTDRELDVLIAEKLFGWERRELFDYVLNPAFFSDPQNNRMYAQSGKAVYLVRPGRFAESQEPVCAREIVGSVTIGGDKDLPRYSTDPAVCKQVREKLAERFFYVRIDINRNDGKPWNQCRVWNPDLRGKEFAASADTEERAVCLCALKTVGVEVSA